MNILLIGSNGQLGWELQRTVPDGISLTSLDYPEIDIRNPESVRQTINLYSPDWVINAAAYTAVDKAEADIENAYAVNATGIQYLAEAVQSSGGRLAHVSTDFVFSGEQAIPYRSTDVPSPCCVYGQSKLQGEQALMQTLPERSFVIRTAWLYSAHGQNFVKTMLRLMSEKEELSVVDDQFGTPTWAKGLALALWRGIENDLVGTFHWSDAGVASWYDFAVAIQEEAYPLGLLDRSIPIQPVSTDQYPTPAQRPPFSVLEKRSTWDALTMEGTHWRKQLRLMLGELKHE